MENKVKHLELITGIINRMSNHSFMLKGWTITLLVLIASISFTTIDSSINIWIYIFVTTGFWGLDNHYLYTERIYRDLYDEVIKKEDDDIDFSMNVTHLRDWKKWIKSFFSKTLFLYYGFLIVISILINFIPLI